MGAVTKTFKNAFSNPQKPAAQAKAPVAAAPAPAPKTVAEAPVVKTTSTTVSEELAARRRARRSARALLSESRLTPEQGIGGTTLGAGPMA